MPKNYVVKTYMYNMCASNFYCNIFNYKCCHACVITVQCTVIEISPRQLLYSNEQRQRTKKYIPF